MVKILSIPQYFGTPFAILVSDDSNPPFQGGCCFPAQALLSQYLTLVVYSVSLSVFELFELFFYQNQYWGAGKFKIIKSFSKFDTQGDFQGDFQDNLRQKNRQKKVSFFSIFDNLSEFQSFFIPKRVLESWETQHFENFFQNLTYLVNRRVFRVYFQEDLRRNIHMNKGDFSCV